jgi:hypothetical protein
MEGTPFIVRAPHVAATCKSNGHPMAPRTGDDETASGLNTHDHAPRRKLVTGTRQRSRREGAERLAAAQRAGATEASAPQPPAAESPETPPTVTRKPPGPATRPPCTPRKPPGPPLRPRCTTPRPSGYCIQVCLHPPERSGRRPQAPDESPAVARAFSYKETPDLGLALQAPWPLHTCNAAASASKLGSSPRGAPPRPPRDRTFLGRGK